jgi:Cof subfamily protein (haloacid dehalogenase superfamily)
MHEGSSGVCIWQAGGGEVKGCFSILFNPLKKEVTVPFPYRLAAIDLDGTLLGPDHRVSKCNQRAVRALAAHGVICVIASGRMHEATTRFAEELGLEAPIISYNGSMVRHSQTGEVWHHMRVPKEAASEVISFCAEHNLHLNYYLNDHLYVAQRGHWAEFYLRQTGSPMEVVGDLRPLRGTEPTKMILIDTPEVIDRLLEYFHERFGSTLYITKTNPEYLEFMNPKTNKGVALELVAKRLGVSREETLAFGDGRNDLPMITWAGLGVAMGSAQPEVQAAADRVAPPYDADGLAQVIEELLVEHACRNLEK